MNKKFLLLLLILVCFLSCKLTKNNKDEEVQTSLMIVSENRENSSTNDNFYTFFSEISFAEELISILSSKEDTVFIFPRFLLEMTKPKYISDTLLIYKFISLTNKYEIKLKTCSFNAMKHTFIADTSWQDANKYFVFSNDTIDGKKIYGVDGTIPKREIDIFEVKINDKSITIPLEYYNDLYELKLNFSEAYESKDGKYLYLYLKGSDGAASYTVKFVFDSKRFVTRILTPLCGFDFIDGIKYDCV